jgi:hypothetical protein
LLILYFSGFLNVEFKTLPDFRYPAYTGYPVHPNKRQKTCIQPDDYDPVPGHTVKIAFKIHEKSFLEVMLHSK